MGNIEIDMRLTKELHLKEMSFLVKNLNDTIIDSIIANPNVFSFYIRKMKELDLKLKVLKKEL